MAKKCPICNVKMVEIYCHLDFPDGHKCPDGHYVFSDSSGENGGFLVKVGNRVLSDLYSGSVRQCRLQNVIIRNWIKRERKRFKRKMRKTHK